MTEMRFPYTQGMDQSRDNEKKKSTTRLDWKLTSYNMELMKKIAIEKEVWPGQAWLSG